MVVPEPLRFGYSYRRTQLRLISLSLTQPQKMSPAMAKLAVVACMMALVYITPATADFATFRKFGEHAHQMQRWKQGVKSYISSLANLANYLRTDTLALNRSIQTSMYNSEHQASTMNIMADDLLTRLSDLQDNLTTASSDDESPLAFQADVVSAGVTPMAISYVPIKHGNVILNDGGHFDSSTGLFTAPVTGLYWFHATLTVPGGKREMYLRKSKVDGTTENIAYLNFYNNQETSTTTVTIMHPGDTMGMYPTTSPFINWDLPGGNGNTFAGYLVARYDDPDYTPPVTNAAGDTTTTTAAP
ncbi:uncharacterized protein [Littorina saxatilis]|uniref:C1q domain-containing protein n=1 Tax=Littorina saxatilis TaxID=31220 RepID=A0AAN9GLW0_9CAEN